MTSLKHCRCSAIVLSVIFALVSGGQLRAVDSTASASRLDKMEEIAARYAAGDNENMTVDFAVTTTRGKRQFHSEQLFTDLFGHDIDLHEVQKLLETLATNGASDQTSPGKSTYRELTLAGLNLLRQVEDPATLPVTRLLETSPDQAVAKAAQITSAALGAAEMKRLIICSFWNSGRAPRRKSTASGAQKFGDFKCGSG